MACDIPEVVTHLRGGHPQYDASCDVCRWAAATQGGVGPLKGLVKETTVRVEKEVIVRALEQTGGNVTRAAELLAISRKSLQNKMKEYDLRDNDEA